MDERDALASLLNLEEAPERMFLLMNAKPSMDMGQALMILAAFAVFGIIAWKSKR